MDHVGLHRLPFSYNRTVGLVLAVAAVTCALVAWPAHSEAGSQRYKAMLSVAGSLTITSEYDNLITCSPGRAWTLAETSEVNIRDKVIVERSGPRRLNSTAAITPGGAVSKNSLLAYEESNYCLPDEPVKIEKPKCKSYSGKGAAGLYPDPRAKGPPRVSFGIQRLTGLSQIGDCTGPSVTDVTPFGADITALDNIYAGIELPLDLRVSSFRTLGIGKRLIRTIRVGGPCEGAIVYRGSKVSKAADGDCEVEGAFKVTVKRLTKSSKQGVPLS